MFKLALCHLKFHKLLTAVLIFGLTVTFFLPLGTWLVSGMLKESMTGRADATPLLIGSKGSPFLLTLDSIYYKTGINDPISAGTLRRFRERCKGRVIPLHTRHSVKGVPVVGTSYPYFGFRNLEAAAGRLPAMLGEAVAGSAAARKLRIEPGDGVVSDCESLYDISAEYPLKLRITGVLARTGTPDDNVIFTDVKTAWIMDGIGHGHESAIPVDPEEDDTIIFIEASEVKYNSRLKKYNEVTPRNAGTFHFHGDEDAFPLSALIVVPASDKERVLVWAETNQPLDGSESGAVPLQAVFPSDEVAKILEIIFDVKTILDSFSVLTAVCSSAFLFLVLSLLYRLRKDETEIIYRIGGSRHAIVMLLGLETALVLLVSLVLALLLSLALKGAVAAMLV